VPRVCPLIPRRVNSSTRCLRNIRGTVSSTPFVCHAHHHEGRRGRKQRPRRPPGNLRARSTAAVTIGSTVSQNVAARVERYVAGAESDGGCTNPARYPSCRAVSRAVPVPWILLVVVPPTLRIGPTPLRRLIDNAARARRVDVRSRQTDPPRQAQRVSLC